MLYLACSTISGVDLAQYRVSLAKDWVSVECGTREELFWTLRFAQIYRVKEGVFGMLRENVCC